MTTKDLIVAIEIGSSSVNGAAGCKRADGTLEVVAYASEPAGEFIHNGVVKNIDKTSNCLKAIVNKLQDQLPDTFIDKVYVGLGGYTLHSVMNQVEANFDEETRVTGDIKERMENENETTQYPGCILVHVIPHGYMVDSLTAEDPVGYNCTYLRGSYLNLLMRLSVMENLADAFKMAQVEEADDLLMPLLLSEQVLTDTERQSGCALVDIGSETTTVGICKDGMLCNLSVIPLGARHISGDLMTVGIALDEAEELKRTVGLATDNRDTTSYTARSGNSIRNIELTRIMKGRFEEILANVRNRIDVAGYGEGRLIAGTVFTGGGMEIAGAADFVRSHAAFAKMRVATPNADNVLWTADEKPIASRQLAMATLLMAGTMPCCIVTKAERTKDFEFGEGNYTLGGLFDENGESAAAQREADEARRREEEKKRIQEEREKQRAEKEAKPQRRSMLGRMMTSLRNKAMDLINEDNDEQ